jgi:hypothetical protein
VILVDLAVAVVVPAVEEVLVDAGDRANARIVVVIGSRR